jgi:hypothetical protein
MERTKFNNKKTEILEDNETEIERQHRYVESLKAKGAASFSLVATEAFVQGMRDSGYRSTATAIDEFIDNSIQAQASRIDILYELEKQQKKGAISKIAIIDNGHGMEPDMIRAAVLWGGTHRANDRSGFGRYGFGLPSAAVSISKQYEVYSKTNGHNAGWHKVIIDLPDICAGRHTNKEGIVVAPEAQKADLPDFIADFLGDRELKHGTVILLNTPDRLSTGYVKPASFHNKIMKHLGVTYRYMIRICPIYVNNEKVEPVDPLFLDPAARFYDVCNGILAEKREPLNFEVKTGDGEKTGWVRMRFSYMPYGFQIGDKEDKHKRNERFPIMKENNGYFIITRAGRQIDIIDKANFPKEAYNKTIVNNDRNWAVEVDFDPVLDEEFGITVNKQQVNISDRMWAIFDSQGIGPMMKALWQKYQKESQENKAKKDSEEAESEVKESESVMTEAEKFIRKPKKSSPEKESQAKQRVDEEAESKAKETGESKEEHIKKLLKHIKERPYKVMFENKEGMPFFRVEQFGAQKRLHINGAHRFYTDLYSPATPRSKTALELLLFAIGSCEIESIGDMETFYKVEKIEWSNRLDLFLTTLDKYDPIRDSESAADAIIESEAV